MVFSKTNNVHVNFHWIYEALQCQEIFLGIKKYNFMQPGILANNSGKIWYTAESISMNICAEFFCFKHMSQAMDELNNRVDAVMELEEDRKKLEEMVASIQKMQELAFPNMLLSLIPAMGQSGLKL